MKKGYEVDGGQHITIGKLVALFVITLTGACMLSAEEVVLPYFYKTQVTIVNPTTTAKVYVPPQFVSPVVTYTIEPKSFIKFSLPDSLTEAGLVKLEVPDGTTVTATITLSTGARLGPISPLQPLARGRFYDLAAADTPLYNSGIFVGSLVGSRVFTSEGADHPIAAGCALILPVAGSTVFLSRSSADIWNVAPALVGTGDLYAFAYVNHHTTGGLSYVPVTPEP